MNTELFAHLWHILFLSDPLYTLRSKCFWLLLILCTFHAVAVSCCWCCCYVVYVYVYVVDFVGSCLRWQCLFLLAMFVFVGNVCFCWQCLLTFAMFVYDGNVFYVGNNFYVGNVFFLWKCFLCSQSLYLLT